MRDDGGNSDPSRHGARSGGGVKSSSHPSGSPSRGARRSPRRSPDREPRHHTSTRPEPPVDPRHAHPPRRGREPDRRSSVESSSRRRAAGPDDLIPRYRDHQHVHHQDPVDKPRRRSRSRGRAASPHSAKRHRSRSHSPGHRHRKKSKKHGGYDDRSSKHHRHRHSPHDYRKSPPRPYSPPPRRDENSSRPRHHHSGDESPADRSSRRPSRDSLYRAADGPRPHHSRSPVPSSRHTSRSGRPSSRDRHGPRSSLPPTRDHSIPDLERRPSHNDHPPPRSPNGHRDPRRRRESPDPWGPPRPDIDDEMPSRGSYRGAYHHSSYPHRPQYHTNGPRGYSQSPPPQPPYHDSPPRSPYGSARTGWYSPSHQYPQQPYSQGGGSGYGPPTGPSAHYSHGPPRSPSYGGPSLRGSYRGNDRGGGSRGGSGFSRGGGQRNSHFKAAYPGPGGPTDSARGYTSDEAPTSADEKRPGRGDEDAGNRSNRISDERKTSPERTQQEPEEVTPRKDNHADQKTPSGSGGPSGKFSFAFKPAKPSPAAPKPEISQKLNAAPQKRVPSLEKSQKDRAPPPSAPTEPASGRARYDARNPPEGPRYVPRMRKVKKVVRRPKPRPTLSTELVDSESVYFRKPGNESVIGSGTYGKVFKGLNVYTGELVALKRIRMEGERDGFPVTAMREIKLLQSLRHKNIVNLREVMVERNDCFMVFEYLSHDLTGLLNHPTFKLEAAQKKHLAMQLMEALDYLHTRGVLHRDIKAANILVSSSGILKLADFGLARFYAKHHRLDYTNRVITIWYRSPELLLGETKYTAAVDVWSAACVMVEIFARGAIFPGDGTELSQLDKIYGVLGTPNLRDWPGLVDMPWFELLKPTVRRDNVFGSKYKDKISPEAFNLLSAMFSYDPARRPTAAEVLQHAYFTTEEPLPKQAIELSSIGGDWHEFESKALRKENDRRDREARKASRDKDRKRPIESSSSHDQPRDAKRQNNTVDGLGTGQPPDPPPARDDAE